MIDALASNVTWCRWIRDELAAPSAGRYSFRGPVDVIWDGAAAAVAVTSKRLEASFGVVEADAALDIGLAVSRLTHRSPIMSGARQAGLGALAAGVTYLVGALLGTAVH